MVALMVGRIILGTHKGHPYKLGLNPFVSRGVLQYALTIRQGFNSFISQVNIPKGTFFSSMIPIVYTYKICNLLFYPIF